MEKSKVEEFVQTCPGGTAQLEEAKAVFLANPGWKRIYDSAPAGAKQRLDVSFWFSHNKDTMGPDMFCLYRNWRTDVERQMTEEDLEFMIANMDKEAAVEHYTSLLKSMRTATPVEPDVKLMSYDDFFAMLDRQGEFKSFDYDDETKRSIVADFLPVLEGSGDPLETHLEDILATAVLKEARAYPKDEIMYVRVEVRFLTATAEWSRPYQMLAAWDCSHKLKGYVFPVGKGRRSEVPIEMEDPENKAQRKKRMQLMAARISA